MASQVQRAFMPEGTLELQGCQFSFVSKPSHQVSGDYFDVFTPDSDYLGFCIADASGHGMAAALITANMQSAVRIFANQNLSPGEVCRRTNQLLERTTDHGNFLSFFYATIDHRTRRLTYTNAGHEPPILLRCDGSYERLEKGGMPIGIKVDSTYEQAGLTVESGSRLVLYTDGVVELRNRRDEEFGVDRLLRTILKNRKYSPIHELCPQDKKKDKKSSRTNFAHSSVSELNQSNPGRLRPQIQPMDAREDPAGIPSPRLEPASGLPPLTHPSRTGLSAGAQPAHRWSAPGGPG